MLGRFFGRKHYTVSLALEDYAADIALRGNRSLCKSEISTLRRHLGELQVSAVTVAVLRRYQAERKESGLAPATVNKHLAVLSAALNLAASNEQIDSVPRFPRRLRAAAPRQGFFEEADYRAIRKELPQYARLVLDFGWYSGWRRNEVLTLSRGEVFLSAKQIRLHPDRSKNRDARVLPLMGFGLECVEEALSTQGRTVFHRENGRPISATTWHGVWSAATKRAGSRLLFHDLRRSVVRRLELEGVPRKTAMAWVGHRTEAIYLRYSISTEKDLVSAGERMLRRFNSAEGKIVPFRR